MPAQYQSHFGRATALTPMTLALYTQSTFSDLSVAPSAESAGDSCVLYPINDPQTPLSALQSRYGPPFLCGAATRKPLSERFPQLPNCAKPLPVCEDEILSFLSGQTAVIQSNRYGAARPGPQFGPICESVPYSTSLQKRRNSQSTHRPRCFGGTGGIRSARTSARISSSWRRTSFRRRVVTGTRTALRAGIR